MNIVTSYFDARLDFQPDLIAQFKQFKNSQKHNKSAHTLNETIRNVSSRHRLPTTFVTNPSDLTATHSYVAQIPEQTNSMAAIRPRPDGQFTLIRSIIYSLNKI